MERKREKRRETRRRGENTKPGIIDFGEKKKTKSALKNPREICAKGNPKDDFFLFSPQTDKDLFFFFFSFLLMQPSSMKDGVLAAHRGKIYRGLCKAFFHELTLPISSPFSPGGETEKIVLSTFYFPAYSKRGRKKENSFFPSSIKPGKLLGRHYFVFSFWLE